MIINRIYSYLLGKLCPIYKSIKLRGLKGEAFTEGERCPPKN